MQDALLRLTEYWASRGCVIAQPMNTEVGAGTLNPATALRVLGPEPWRVAYVEPSVRPDDSRYGDNPNRLQTHTQFQVILKPEPGDPQTEYLGSLTALGIDTARHDVRFVEDNWASPALGAWGLGWEVWLDGLEITQFTYFQQSGGMTLDPVSVELTYGIERILMALQGVRHFKDITVAPGITYGEAFGQAELEMSSYYLDDADVAASQTLFETYAAEADRLIRRGRPIPAHTYVLKCSHAFNVLDSRGAISTTERARAFARMRGLAHQVAELWLRTREEAGHPLGVATASAPADEKTSSTEIVSAEATSADAASASELPRISAPATLVFEIGVEELPPAEVPRTAEAVRAALATKLGASRLGYGEIRVVAAPRRVVATVGHVQPYEPDEERTTRGPRVGVAYAPDGTPTKAALGFARSQGVGVEELQRLETNGGEYVGVVRTVAGRPAAEVLAGILPEVVSGLRAEKNMRWSAPGLTFSRPIRWILALLDEHVVPFTVSDLAAGRTTRLHRDAARTTLEVPTAEGYLDLLRTHGVAADPAERRERIAQASVALAAQAGGQVDLTGEAAVLEEATNLVEWPTPILGGFDQGYLSLPAEVLTTVMKKHQRYLPVRDADGRLLPSFVAVANGDCDADAVRAGNEAVLRARFEDASFFWRHDLGTPLEELREGLGRLTFETRLGSMADRAGRIGGIAAALAGQVGLTAEEHATLARAGHLVKFDLASAMVTELTSLAGIMAREYARRAGEPDAVAEALFETELPRQAGDALPASVPGALLALADRLDLLAGLFAIGSAPTGSSDPFGLRRAALGAIGILLAHPRLAGLDLREALALAAARLPVPVDRQALADAEQFTVRRLEQQLLDQGHAAEAVRAVLPLATVPARAARTAADLTALAGDPRFAQVTEAMLRVRRILPPDSPAKYDPALFEEAAEHRLHQTLVKVHADLPASATLPEFTRTALALAEPVDQFFTDVLVMAEDPKLKANRLGLLAAIRDLGDGVLDWTALP